MMNLLLIFWCLIMALGFWGSLITLRHLSPRIPWPWRLSRRSFENPENVQCDAIPISILKPLKGLDPSLEQNLRTFFELDYPEFEILFCLEGADDPALKILERFILEYPHIQARIILAGPHRLSALMNPKVHNMAGAYELAKFDLVLISDSNVCVTTDDVASWVDELKEGIGVVTALVAGQGAKGFAAELEALHLNTFYARWMMISYSFKQACVVGKMMLFRKSTLDRLGGLRTLGRFLAEDYMTGLGMKFLGLKIRVAKRPVSQVLSYYSLREFWRRHIRWGRIRKAHAPLAFMGEPFTMSLPMALMGAWLFTKCTGLYFATACGSILSLYLAQDLILSIRMSRSFKPAFLIVWICREILIPFLWVQALLGNHVLWRGRRMQICPGGILVEPNAKKEELGKFPTLEEGVKSADLCS